MRDLIDRKDLYQVMTTKSVELFDKGLWRTEFLRDLDFRRGFNFALQLVIDAPSAEPERKKGKWRHYEGQYSCEVCGAEVDDISPFCPNCGADMRGG